MENGIDLKQLFRACDSNGTGKIAPKDFKELCKKFEIREHDAEAIFNDLDHDRNGEIDFEDFCHGFRDFLTPGSRRGSLQVSSADASKAMKQLEEMEKRHASAQNAWKHFVNNVGSSNSQPLLKNYGSQLNDIVEELRFENDGKAVEKLEKTLTSLMLNVNALHDDYKSLEDSFRKERESHAARLAALGEELDQQLVRAELKVKNEARQEAMKQFDLERKKMAEQMQNEMAELTAHITTFQKVEQWLADKEAQSQLTRENKKDHMKLTEAESENRTLKNELVETKMKASLLQSQLLEKRQQYVDLCDELETEKVVSSEYRNQCDLMQNHLSILSQTNRALSDAHDVLSFNSTNHIGNLSRNPSISSNLGANSSSIQQQGKSPHSLLQPPEQTFNIDAESKFRNHAPSEDVLKPSDSGRESLYDEMLAGQDRSRWTSEGAESNGCASYQSDMKSQIISIGTESHNSTTMTSAHDSEDTSSEIQQDLNVPVRTFKVILAGDSSVGKTTFIERVCNGRFIPNLSSTIGVDFRIKNLTLDGNCVTVQLWDTAGQERFRSLTKSYFRRADGVILMYDICNEHTFLNVRQWIMSVEEGAGRTVPVILCGNKEDMRQSYPQVCVKYDDGLKLSTQSGIQFLETSPKSGYNCDEAIELLARDMSLMEDKELKNSLHLKMDSEATKKKFCCK